jgi:hypothetical protein
MKKLILAVILTLSGVLGAHAAANTPTFTPTFYPGSLAQRQDIAALQAALKAGVPALPLSNTPTWQPSASMTTTLTPTITSTNTRVEVYIRLTDTPTPTITPTFNSALLTASPTPFTPTLTPVIKGGAWVGPNEAYTPGTVMFVPPTTTPSYIPTPFVLPTLPAGKMYKMSGRYSSNVGAVTLTISSPLAPGEPYSFFYNDTGWLPLFWHSAPITFAVNGPGLNLNYKISIIDVNP